MRTITKYLILLVSMLVLIGSYLYVVFWSEEWKWKFWVTGELDDLLYLMAFTFIWGALVRAVWKLEVRLLF
ncbi:MAG: hypothetical protein GXO00_00245 [Candidatus Diapherotrites archaeon]|nr:hypothetical protein [Candidatus Diapherotrites archaeon]